MNGKQIRKREKKIMKENSLVPVVLSGAGLDKEDGKSETILAQLKSTSKDSYIIKVGDLKMLFDNATITNKIPVFLIDFMAHDTLLYCFRKGDIEDTKTMQEIANFLHTKKDIPNTIKPIENGNKTLADLL